MTTSPCFYSLFLGLENMANLTEQGHHKTWEALSCEPNVDVLYHNIFLALFNIFLSLTASLGNVLILIALHKESSLHPASKLMFRYLAITDLCVGIISHPVFAAELQNVGKRRCGGVEDVQEKKSGKQANAHWMFADGRTGCKASPVLPALDRSVS